MSAIWKGQSILFTGTEQIVLVEAPDSPQYIFGEKSTCIRRYGGQYALCLASALPRGRTTVTPLPAAFAGLTMPNYFVSKCTVNKKPKGVGELVIEWESISGGTVPEDPVITCSLTPMDEQPRMETHPLFAVLTNADRALVRTYCDSQDPDKRDEMLMEMSGMANAVTMLKLIDKILKGRETFYQASWLYIWTTTYLTVPALSDGGFIETPDGPLAGLLGTSIWLRKADEYTYDGTVHSRTKSWLGAKSWDRDLYP